MTAIGEDGAIYLTGIGPQAEHDTTAGSNDDLITTYPYTAKMTHKGEKFVSVVSGYSTKSSSSTSTIIRRLAMLDDNGQLWASDSMGGEKKIALTGSSGGKYVELYGDPTNLLVLRDDSGHLWRTPAAAGSLIGDSGKVDALGDTVFRQVSAGYGVSTGPSRLAGVDEDGSVWVTKHSSNWSFSIVDPLVKVASGDFTYAFPVVSTDPLDTPMALAIKTDGVYAIGEGVAPKLIKAGAFTRISERYNMLFLLDSEGNVTAGGLSSGNNPTWTDLTSARLPTQTGKVAEIGYNGAVLFGRRDSGVTVGQLPQSGDPAAGIWRRMPFLIAGVAAGAAVAVSVCGWGRSKRRL